MPATHDKTDNPLLSVEGLCVDYPAGGGWRRRPPFRAVDQVNFSIARGTTLGLVGESGCGKSSIGRALTRLTEPSAGRVRFDGLDLLALSGRALRHTRRRMQIVFQDPFGSLNPRRRIGESISEPLVLHERLSRAERRRRVAELLEQVGLRAADAERFPHELSGGQRQRVVIARGISLGPDLMICDEPVSALDVSIQAQILNLLGDLQKNLGLTYLFIAHNLAVVEQLSDRVAVMYRGRIVEIADTRRLFTAPAHPYTLSLLAAVPRPDPARRGTQHLASWFPTTVADESPTACAFAPRCPFATEQCLRETPALEPRPPLPAGHAVACHHADTVLRQTREE